jgi:hypothetical protein
MKRSPLRRKKPLRASRGLRRASKLRRTQLREYSEKRLEFLRANLICHVCKKATSTEAHHVRGRIGKRLLDFKYCLAICFGCHRKIHDNPKWARAEGYLQ